MRLTNVTLYPTARCQLDCLYCPLTKIQYLNEMDKDFEDSYKDKGYYTRQLMRLGWENIKDIHRIELWGGEPTLALHRTHDTVRDFVELLPKLDMVFFSTNLAHSKVAEEIEGLVDVLGEFPDRNFRIGIQLSIDGPPEITDAGRGAGVTEKFLENYHLLMDKKWFSEKYPNVRIQTMYKPTLDTVTLKKFLDIDYMEYYYKWFEDNLYDDAVKNLSKKYNGMICAIPNIATPLEATKEDGIDFYQIQKNAMYLSLNNPFRYYKNIVMYTRGNWYKESNQVKYCGVGRSIVELLPNGKYCGCHRAFLTYCDEYRSSVNNYDVSKPLDHRSLSYENPVFIFDSPEEFIEFAERVEKPMSSSSSFLVSQGVIRYLANLGQIDERYKDPIEAHKAANLMSEYSSQCIYDNYTVCGTQMTGIFSLYRMFLNGAIDVVKVATERKNLLNEIKQV